MSYGVLYIFVEGNDDERFFREILLPMLKKKYDDVKIIKYSQKPKKYDYVQKFVRSISSMGRDYIFVTDINNSLCIPAKKRIIRNKVKNIDENKILVVVKEIESWYLAGLDANLAKNLGIKKVPETTENITKEQFHGLIPEKFSQIDFKREVLKNFSIQTAKRKNKSLRYCIDKYGKHVSS